MKYPNMTWGTMEAVINKLGGEEGVKEFLRGSVEIVVKSIINFIGTTTIPATTEQFVAKEKFHKNSKEVKFYRFYGSFEEDFLSGDGKIEEPLNEQELRYGNLTKNSVDGPIIEELGGEAKAETTLTELYNLLKKQGDGKEGVLLTNGHANIFYIRDQNGVLRAVGTHWDDDGWSVNANSVENPNEWNSDNQVFSRNCCFSLCLKSGEFFISLNLFSTHLVVYQFLQFF